MPDDVAAQRDIETMRRLHAAFNRRDIDAMLSARRRGLRVAPARCPASKDACTADAASSGSGSRRSTPTGWSSGPTPASSTTLGDSVLAIGTWHAVARASGLRLDAQPAAWLVRFDDGVAVSQETFTDLDEARRAAGL